MNINQMMAISLVLLLGAFGDSVADEPSADSMMSVTLSGEQLGEILNRLHAQSGYDFVVDAELARTRGPQMYVAPIPALRAIRVVAAAYGTCAEVVSDTLVAFRECDDGNRSLGAAFDQADDPPKVRLGVVVEEKGAEYPPNGDTGVAVTEIFDEQAAGYKAGIRAGDVILGYNGESVSGGVQLQRLVGDTRPGDRVPVTVLRGGERLSFNVQF